MVDRLGLEAHELDAVLGRGVDLDQSLTALRLGGRDRLDLGTERRKTGALLFGCLAEEDVVRDRGLLGLTRGAVVLTKVDEAVKLGPALDALIRHRLKVVAVANGQRVPEDWHRLSGATLVQRALRAAGSSAWRMDPSDVNLVFAGSTVADPAAGAL